ncbi:hypothetical protein F511_45104 [Dorcoceras hygrometricum]|uniref:Uncharacterized protein n=1 Tax=Dorcoceras hygrometricum TaxID=472368 RepID=A0A2Z6ZWW4_9LAMI|nr:hypothetical protein F511_45104 [Dorcoceras hygrometricum]
MPPDVKHTRWRPAQYTQEFKKTVIKPMHTISFSYRRIKFDGPEPRKDNMYDR